MSTLHELLQRSVAQHRQLHDRMTAIEKRLPILDLESTIKASDDMDMLFLAIQNTDQQILAIMDADSASRHIDLIEQRMELGRILLDQYKSITPKLKTRLAGYKAELFKIRHGIQTMGGYAPPPSKAGRIINTAN